MEENLIQENEFTETESQREKRARKHVQFKIHLCIYILVVAFFWLLWFFLFKNTDGSARDMFFKLSWAITLFWLLFIIGHYLFAYKWNRSYLEKEVGKLQKKEKKLKKQLAELRERVSALEQSAAESENAGE